MCILHIYKIRASLLLNHHVKGKVHQRDLGIKHKKAPHISETGGEQDKKQNGPLKIQQAVLFSLSDRAETRIFPQVRKRPFPCLPGHRIIHDFVRTKLPAHSAGAVIGQR
jgi:hypothetical protein